LSGSGGSAVIGADACERAGLVLPPFSKEVQQKISTFFPRTSVRNPVDLADPHPPARVLAPVFDIVSAIEEIDAILFGRMFLSVKGPGLVLGFSEGFEQGREVLKDIPLTARDKHGKPIIMVLNEEVTDVELIEFEVDRRNLRNYYLSHGIPVYPTVERAVRAITNVVKYNERLSQHSGG
jgi:acyl-CoA synthetase (NDP forming)